MRILLALKVRMRMSIQRSHLLHPRMGTWCEYKMYWEYSLHLYNECIVIAKKSCTANFMDFFNVAVNIYYRNKFSASVHFCNCIFLIRCFHNIWNPLNCEMKPFNLKNTITKMYTCWKLISIMNIKFYLNCWILFTCARPFNSSRRGTDFIFHHLTL